MKSFFLIYALQLENHRPRTIVTAGYHDFFIIRPATHNGPALQGGIHIATDAVPCFRSKLAVHHFEKSGVIHDELLAIPEDRTFS